MDTLNYILTKYNLTSDWRVEIPDVGRNHLAELLHELDFKVGVEVGVQEGKYSEVICKANPQMRVYGVDAWEAYVTHDGEENEGKSDKNRSSKEMGNKFYDETIKRMAPYRNYEILREYSIDALKYFRDGSLDFVYIDADHEYSHVMEDIKGWSKKLKKGGIISGHDYYTVKDPKSLMHVKAAVEDYVFDHKIRPLIIWGSNDGTPGVTYRDRRRSWSWVN